MKKGNDGGRKSGDFLAGKGFYIILFACIAIIGVSAWILVFTSGMTNTAEVSAPLIAEQPQPPPRIPPPANELPGRPPINDETAFSPHIPEEPRPEPPTLPPEVPAAPTIAEQPPEQREDLPPATEPLERTVDEMTFVWPVMGSIEMPFSIEMPIYHRTLAVWRTHPGIDIAAAIGTRVLAVTDGTVIDIFEDDMMGTTVVIDHGAGLMSIYSNLARTPVVVTGDGVTLGAVIGAVGDTAIGEIREVAHLHFEMTLHGEPVDPTGFLPSR